MHTHTNTVQYMQKDPHTRTCRCVCIFTHIHSTSNIGKSQECTYEWKNDARGDFVFFVLRKDDSRLKVMKH